MHDLPYITIFCHELGDSARVFTSDEVTSGNHCRIASPVTKNVIHGNECIILFLTRYFMSWIHSSTKNNYQSPISPFSLRTVCSDLALWRHHRWICDVTRTWGTGILTWYSSIILARTSWHKGDLHLRITTMNIDFSPTGIHGLAFKKYEFWVCTPHNFGVTAFTSCKDIT